MADSQLRREVELAVAEMNEKPMSKEYSAELDTHADGPAIDVQVDGEATAHRAYRFFEAAHNAGYVVSNCKVFEEFDIGEPHTRLFLRDAADYLGVNVEEFEKSTRDKVVRSLAREGVPKAKEVAQSIGADTATFTVNDEEAARLENVGFAVATRDVDGNTLYVLLCDEAEALNVNAYERSRADDVAHVAAESGAAFDVSLLD